MDRYEYRVLPAPTKAKRGRYLRGAAQRFADRLEQIFNEMGTEGWEYVRTDTLPNEQRKGMTTTTVTYRNMLVFRRVIMDTIVPQIDQAIAVVDDAPIALDAPKELPALEAPVENAKEAPTASQDQIDATLKLDPFAQAAAREADIEIQPPVPTHTNEKTVPLS
ncbi:MAG: DUF4177 domain-containing protein [Planktomarina sp.]